MTARTRRPAADRGQGWDATTVGLGALFAVLVGISVWTSVVAHVLQFLLQVGVAGARGTLLLMSGGTALGGLCLGSVAYARFRGLDIALSRPRRGSWPTAVVVGVTPAVLAGGTAIVGNAVFGVTFSEMVQRRMSPDVSAEFLLLVLLPPAVFLGLGYGFLFCGVVCERIRDLVGSPGTIPVATALVGFFQLLPVEALHGLRLGVGDAVELVVSLVFGVAFGASLGLYYRHADTESTETVLQRLNRRQTAVVVVAAVGVVGVATGLTELPGAVGDLLWVVVLGIGIGGYELTRSVWVPVVAFAVFDAATSGIVYAEAVVGLAGP